jgi:hypothetical protein
MTSFTPLFATLVFMMICLSLQHVSADNNGNTGNDCTYRDENGQVISKEDFYSKGIAMIQAAASDLK